MNKSFIIGNLVKDPELRTTQSGLNVCTFTVAVNRRASGDNKQPEADFFRVSAWRQLGELCSKYLVKGRKVCVVGSVSASAYLGNDQQPHASLEITADDVEFLSSKGDQNSVSPPAHSAAPAKASNTDDDLPF